MTKKYFLQRVSEVYPQNNFQFINLLENFNNKIKIKVICPIHGEFEISVVNFLNGRGCKYCNKEKRIITTEKFIERARLIHGNTYDYSRVNYNGIDEKIACRNK